MFNGQPFATMILEPEAHGLTGSVGNASIDANQDGEITKAVALAGSSPIIKSSLANGMLHLVCKVEDDEIEWIVRLTSPTSAEIVPGGTDAPKMTIHAEKSQ